MQRDGTSEQQLIFLNTHWGRRYAFTAPQAASGKWIATANFSQNDMFSHRAAPRRETPLCGQPATG